MLQKSTILMAVSATLALSSCAALHKHGKPYKHKYHHGERACKKTSEAEIAALFGCWNDALKTGDAKSGGQLCA
ncbi:hypothetical protein [Neisseria iguanae]|uniref:hypothetical protein n=1 Tax=Neisseria iguanae TaxID=90242 RepID=UPI001B80CBC8|nr:hypothetical protein [Neisseria iguanae]